MKLVFNSTGKLNGTGADAASAYEDDVHFAVADSVSGVSELWRYSYDWETSEVVVAYPGMTDPEAMVQLEADAAAEPSDG